MKIICLVSKVHIKKNFKNNKIFDPLCYVFINNTVFFQVYRNEIYFLKNFFMSFNKMKIIKFLSGITLEFHILEDIKFIANSPFLFILRDEDTTYFIGRLIKFDAEIKNSEVILTNLDRTTFNQ